MESLISLKLLPFWAFWPAMGNRTMGKNIKTSLSNLFRVFRASRTQGAYIRKVRGNRTPEYTPKGCFQNLEISEFLSGRPLMILSGLELAASKFFKICPDIHNNHFWVPDLSGFVETAFFFRAQKPLKQSGFKPGHKLVELGIAGNRHMSRRS